MTLKALLISFVLMGTSVSAWAQSTPSVKGEVKKVDMSAGKMTLQHGAIPNLDMSAMTMVFKAADPAMLKSVKAGDKVKFTAERVNGQLTVTTIHKAK
ncbi:MAG: copper-binding protein [Hyphomicrobiales bacterium]|nr:copper-binding protein [Hyphomicrobiales bacterium]MDE2115026.1 copper-binding protein [Hyphomicrobiales bacterium]